MSAERYQGRLELTWTNKDLRLLAEEDGTYTWVPPADYRVAEVRLMYTAGSFGTVATERNRAQDNLLIRGDALYALNSLIELPEFAREYAGRISVAYLDPPFNTQQSFLHYDDALEHSVWLTMMRDRLLSIRELLAPDGSVWVHLDDSEVAYCRVLMDELFGRDNFVASVIWEKTDSPRMDADYFSGRHDTILVFRKSEAFRIRRLAQDDGVPKHYNRVDETGARYYTKPLRAMGGQGSTRKARPTLYYPLTAPDGTEVYPQLPDGQDGAWRWNPQKYARDAALIEWVKGRRGWVPYFRIYASDDTLRPPETIWFHTDVGSTRTSAREIKQLTGGTSFATPKPEALIARIIALATDEGDIVLDCFVGSGTTAAVAHKMNRHWLAVERESDTLATFAIPRLTKVVEGTDPGGITEVVDWGGGGGFRVLDVAPSMFRADGGQVFLSEWATNGKLAEVTAAQLHYDCEYDPPFCGRRGRSRLAVIDGLLNEDVARLLVTALPDNERLVACGTAIDPAARDALRSLRPGSTVRKIPQSILQEYRLTVRGKQPLTPSSTPAPAPQPVAAS
jgi:adenine-specific DNA-methyltransferase